MSLKTGQKPNVSLEDVALIVELQNRVSIVEASNQRMTEQLEAVNEMEGAQFDGQFILHGFKVD